MSPVHLIASIFTGANTDNRTLTTDRILDMPQPPKTDPRHAPTEELDLVIPDMDTANLESKVKATLEMLPGIHSVRLVERGAFIRYNPLGIDKDQICVAIRQAGFRASTYQDSKTGATGLSSQ